MSRQLGIDTGGTYTDAVIVDAAGRVIASHKSLTTPYDLTIGIGQALAGLPPDALVDIRLVALSTTLSTNSVIEGRGSPVAVLLAGYTPRQVERSGLLNILERERIVLLEGGHTATGEQSANLDVAAVRHAVLEQYEKVSAFAVSSMFATRNTAHEVAIRELIGELCDLPVACGHELAASLGAPRRALTAALNARMILYIRSLIDAVVEILRQFAIDATLMIVKGDGSLINVETARLQPVATVLSGPAASVIGAQALSGRNNAIVADMGGTTTDIAIVHDGQPELAEDGARIGEWRPMVEAIRVFSIGLGGDSELRFNGDLCLSKRRVVPVSLLAQQYPHVLALLRDQLHREPSARHNRFALCLSRNEVLLGQLSVDEQAIWERLVHSPIEIDELAMSDRRAARAVARMQRLGLIIYSGFTPSDATHVLGLSTHWCREAAEIAARLWSRQMRYLYGYGSWAADDIQTPCQHVLERMTQLISHTLIEAGLEHHTGLNGSFEKPGTDAQRRQFTQLLADILLQKGRPECRQLFSLEFAQNYPLVAVGGPAGDFFPDVARKLGVELVLPEHREVANAVGAVMGSVIQHAHVTVTQPEFGRFCVFHRDQPLHFEKLDRALEAARELAHTEALRMARSAGARDAVCRLHEDAAHVKHAIDGELFVSTTITAVASGRPDCTGGLLAAIEPLRTSSGC